MLSPREQRNPIFICQGHLSLVNNKEGKAKEYLGDQLRGDYRDQYGLKVDQWRMVYRFQLLIL